jgi:hypothetical protein
MTHFFTKSHYGAPLCGELGKWPKAKKENHKLKCRSCHREQHKITVGNDENDS